MKSYETILIFKTQWTDEQIAKELGRFESLLKDAGATDYQASNWGRKELAFEINRSAYGVYHCLNFKSDSPTIIDTLNSFARINEGLLKFQTHRLGQAARKFQGNPRLLKEGAAAN